MQCSRPGCAEARVCFSAEADLAAGVIIGVIAIDGVRHVRHPAERALAAIPVVLGAHQIVEAFVWWGLHGQVPNAAWRPALWLYLIVAFVVLPVLVPTAVGALEPVASRRRVQVFTAIGVGVAAVLMYAIVRGPIHAAIEARHIAYSVGLWHGGLVVMLYVVATCGSMLASRHSHVRWFGVVNLVAVGLLAWLNRSGFISLWCFWAAITSVAIAVHLRHASQPPVRRAMLPTA